MNILKGIWILFFVLTAGTLSARETLLSEDFRKCTKTTEVTSFDEFTTMPGWSGSKVYQNRGSVKIGTSSVRGELTTPPLDLSDSEATYTLSFKICAWSNDKDYIYILVDNEIVYRIADLKSDNENQGASLETCQVAIKGTDASRITFAASIATRNRFFLDDVMIVKETESPPLPPIETQIVYEEDFANGANGFAFMDTNPMGLTDVWKTVSYNQHTYLKATGYKNGNKVAESMAISPAINMFDVVNSNVGAFITFDHAVNYANHREFASALTLWVSFNYTEENSASVLWEPLAIPVYPDGDSFTFVSSDSISLTALLHKASTMPAADVSNMRIAFRYTSNTEIATTWEVTNIKIMQCDYTTRINKLVILDEDFVTVKEGRVIIDTKSGGLIEIFNLSGQKVYSISAIGIQIIEGLNKGEIYIVRCAGRVAKVAL